MPDSSKVLATNNLKFYYLDYESTARFPDNDVAWGTAWGTPSGQVGAWIDGGYTQGGLNFSAEISRADIRMDQSIDPVLRPATGRTVTISTNLGEFDLSTLVAATGQGSVATLAPTTADEGYDEWSMTSSVADNFFCVAFDIQHPGDDMPVRILGVYCQPTGAENWNFSPAAAALTPFNVTAFPRPTDQMVAYVRDIIAHT